MKNNILNFIKKMFGMKASEVFTRGTGSLTTTDVDYRDGYVSAIQPKVVTPDSFDGLGNTLRALRTFDQWWQPMCVLHAISGLLEAYIFKATGKIVKLSPRLGAKIAKMLDGIPNTEGTYPRIGALVMLKFGTCTEEVLPNDTGLSKDKYINFEITQEMLDDAKKYKIPGFAFVNKEIEAIKNAIFINGAVTGSTCVGLWDALPVKAHPPIGYHYTIWYKYEKVGNDYKIHFKNSWGSGWLSWVLNWLFPGYGYFMWNEYKDKVEDIIAYTEIPKNYLDIMKSLPFKFTKKLSLGMTDIQVKELQKLLNESPETLVALDGAGSAGQETFFFGNATKGALIRYQQKNKLNPTGAFDQATMDVANKRVFGNKLHEWALAIQLFEGYFKGSRSYKNNNPGNLRYSGIFAAMAIGKDDKNFCVFETYEKGLDALKTLLKRAATGLSSVYKPDDTLLQFYGKYAPSSDGNHPLSYATYIAKRIGVTVDTKIKELI